MPAGGRRSTTWTPGHGGPGRPSGRVITDIREAAKPFTKEALDRLAHWMRSEHATASPMAAQAILDRAYGKPKQELDVTHNLPAASAHDETLLAIASAGGCVDPPPEADAPKPEGMVH